MHRLLPQLAAELGAVDGVAPVVAGTVAPPVEGVPELSHTTQDDAHYGTIILLTVEFHEVGPAGDASRQDSHTALEWSLV